MTANIDKQLELNSLIEYSQLINTNLNQEFILGHILLSIMGKMLITKGMVLTNDNRINSPENSYIIKASKGVDKKLSGLSIVTEFPKEPYFELSAIENPSTFLADNGFNFFFKIYFINKLVGILCLGNKISRNSIDKNEFIFIETMLNISAPAIENSMKFDEITRLNNSLSSQLQQLKSLFELSKEFNSNFQDREKIVKLLRYSLLGNFGVKDLVIFSKFRSEDYYIIHSEKSIVLDTKLSEELAGIKEAEIIDNSNLSPLRKLLFENNINLLIPISSNNKVETIVCIGHKLNKTEFTLSDIQFLESIVNLSVISIDNSLLFDEYTEKLKIENELNIAREMQIALLPKSLPEAKGYDLYAVNYPASQVGGDYYDIIKLSDSEFAFVIADVSGKGTPASLLMSNIQSAVHSYLKLYNEDFDIQNVTEKLNELIFQNTTPEKFITFFWGILDTSSGNFTYINAGHNPPILFKKDGSETLSSGGLMLGVLDSGINYDIGTVSIKKDEVLVLYTDGVTEAVNSGKEEFGEPRLMQSVSDNFGYSSKIILDEIVSAINDFAVGTKQFDDITLIVLKKKSG